MVNRLQNNLVPRLLSYPSLGEREREWTSRRGPGKRVCTRNGPVNNRSPGFFSSVHSPAEKAFERELLHCTSPCSNQLPRGVRSPFFLQNSVRGAHARVKVERLEKRARQPEKKKKRNCFHSQNKWNMRCPRDAKLRSANAYYHCCCCFCCAPHAFSWVGRCRGVYLDGLKKWSLV